MKSTVLFVSFVYILVLGAFARADLIASYNITTSNDQVLNQQWKLATLFQTSTNGVPGNNPNANELARDAVIANYLQGNATLSGNDQNNGVLSAGDLLNWNNVKALSFDKVGSNLTNSQSVSPYWLTAEDAATGGYPSGDAVYKNGYYAFQYSFDTTDDLTSYSADELTQLYMNISFRIAADDHLETIFLNGQQIFLDYLYPSYDKQQFAEGSNFQASARLSDIIASGYFLENSINTLEFIIHNTGLNGAASGYSSGENAFGIAINGTIDIDNERKYDDTFAATPEPATALILLTGIAGFAFVKRVRKIEPEKN
ncbi:MAG: PEP-CTERM sorting domain-containing protein [Planctomycetaceae bacterium]|jgi:hypothetical protein|nr:PEP-CTERM sorting domain-containing protein [Planctomycetaceae bacterium]